MKINSRTIDDVFILEIEGEIMGGVESEYFKNVIYKAIEENFVKIVIDLSKATWMNSSGLGMLITGLTTVRSSEGELKLANIADRVKRPLEITKLDTIFEIYNSVEEARNSFFID